MLALVCIAAVGAWIGFANPLFHFPPVVLAFPLGLAWIGLRATSGKNAFKYGWLAGTLAATGCYYWMVIPVQIYGGLPWYIALPCPLLLAAFMSLYYGLFSLSMHFAGQRISGIALCLLAGLSWTTLEMLSSFVLSGFPWINLSAAFAAWPVAIQGASVLGAYGLSGVLACLAVAALLCSTYRSALWLTVVLAIGLTAFGVYRTSAFDVGQRDYTVSLIQGDVDQGAKWTPEYLTKTVRKYTRLSIEAIEREQPDLVIWPETAMTFFVQDQSPLRQGLEILARETKTPIVIGSPAYLITDPKTKAYNLFNRAWLMDATGATNQFYDKEHLVPFGEYMPFEDWVPFEKLVQAAGNFLPGVENRPLVSGDVALGMLICYEAIFPELAQRQVSMGANVLVNISNDAWFGNTSAPAQHLDLAVMRAVEQGRWLARCTNTGITAFVDPVGRIAAKGTQFRAESLSMRIAPLTGLTVYHRIRDWLDAAVYVITAAIFAGLAFKAGRKKGNTL
ncbi:MAG: apolipoprotein N-acyltransferase [Desulfovibrionaceae bacterium]|nr:apolipoprotein N-acyltransferase [Desulfovibrionaceae bacterium]